MKTGDEYVDEEGSLRPPSRIAALLCAAGAAAGLALHGLILVGTVVGDWAWMAMAGVGALVLVPAAIIAYARGAEEPRQKRYLPEIQGWNPLLYRFFKAMSFYGAGYFVAFAVTIVAHGNHALVHRMGNAVACSHSAWFFAIGLMVFSALPKRS